MTWSRRGTFRWTELRSLGFGRSRPRRDADRKEALPIRELQTVTAADLARIVIELELRNLISRIAILADQGDLNEYANQFTEDCVWALPNAPRHGRADIRAGAQMRRAKGLTGPGSASRHVITNVSVSIDGPDEARADSYFMFFQNTTTVPTILNMGSYRDRFVRQGDTWRLARREITFG